MSSEELHEYVFPCTISDPSSKVEEHKVKLRSQMSGVKKSATELSIKWFQKLEKVKRLRAVVYPFKDMWTVALFNDAPVKVQSFKVHFYPGRCQGSQRWEGTHPLLNSVAYVCKSTGETGICELQSLPAGAPQSWLYLRPNIESLQWYLIQDIQTPKSCHSQEVCLPWKWFFNTSQKQEYLPVWTPSKDSGGLSCMKRARNILNAVWHWNLYPKPLNLKSDRFCQCLSSSNVRTFGRFD